MELVPDIAYGNLATSSLAEVLAAAFRTNATGTIAVEQGTGESRVYVQYGSPCGTALYQPAQSFADYLVHVEAVGKSEMAPLARRAEQRKSELSSFLIEQGVLPEEKVLSLLAAYHHEQLVTLCTVREGKYELRGWERPPPWTESIHLDPLRAIVTVLSSSVLEDRRQAILALIGDRVLGISSDFEDLAGRLYVDDADVQAIQLLRNPMTAAAFVRAQGGPAAEASLAAYAMLGLVDEAADQPAFAPASPIQIDVQPSYPLTVEAPEATPVSSGQAGFVLTEEDAGEVHLDFEPTTDPGPSSPFVEEPVVVDESVGSWSEDMSSRLDEALTATPGPESEEFATIPQGAISAPDLSSYPPAEVGDSEPVPSPRPNESRGLLGQLEFEVEDASDSLELDLTRAPKEFLRDSLDREAPRSSRRPRTSGRTEPMLPRLDPGALEHGLPPTRSTIVGRDSRARTADRSAKARPRPSRLDDYNPFRPHFRKEVAGIQENSDPLDEALERALRGPATRLMVERPAGTGRQSTFAEPRPAVAEAMTPPKSKPSKPSRPSKPPSMVEAPTLNLMEAIESSMPARAGEEASGPLDLAVTPGRVGEGDGLALDLARSEAFEEDVATFAPDDPQHDEQVEIADEPSDPPAPPPRAAPEGVDAGGSREAGSEVRRRLLQRALRNISGPFQVRDTPAQSSGVQEPDPFIPPQKDVVDEALEADLRERARKASAGDHFATLDLQRNASTDQVKEAFLSLAKKYHPDRLNAQGQVQLLPAARDVFAKVKEAYDVLLDPATRARHLSELEAKAGGRKMAPGDAKGAYQRGLVYLKRRDFTQAEAELVRAIDADPAPDYLAELAWTLLSNPARRDNARDEVKSLIVRALKGGNPSDRVFVVAAHVARSEGDQVRMEKFFRSAIEKNPKNVEAARELRLIEMRRPAEKPAGLLDRFRKKS